MIFSAITADLDNTALAARFGAGPRLYDPVLAAERWAGWLADLAPEQADAIAALGNARLPLPRGL